MTEKNTREEMIREYLKAADEEVGILVLTRGTKMDGSPFFAYVDILPSKFQAFKRAEAKGNYNLADYGTIVEWGNSIDPPPEIVDAMKDRYEPNPNFANEIVEKAKEIYEKKKRKKRLKEKYNL